MSFDGISGGGRRNFFCTWGGKVDDNKACITHNYDE